MPALQSLQERFKDIKARTARRDEMARRIAEIRRNIKDLQAELTLYEADRAALDRINREQYIECATWLTRQACKPHADQLEILRLLLELREKTFGMNGAPAPELLAVARPVLELTSGTPVLINAITPYAQGWQGGNVGRVCVATIGEHFKTVVVRLLVHGDDYTYKPEVHLNSTGNGITILAGQQVFVGRPAILKALADERVVNGTEHVEQILKALAAAGVSPGAVGLGSI